jgi:hypothetical protein
MNNSLSSLLFYLAGIFLMISGANQMIVKAQNESDGSTGGNLIAENVRSTGYQSFGVGIACFALGSMPRRNKERKTGIDSIEATQSKRPHTPEIRRMRGLFDESEWHQILLAIQDAGIDERGAQAEQSYMTSSDSAAICDNNKIVIAEIRRMSTGKWMVIAPKTSPTD